MKSKSMSMFALLNTPKKGFVIPEGPTGLHLDKGLVKRLLDDLRGKYSDNTDKDHPIIS